MELVKPDKKYEASWHRTVDELRHDPKSIGLWKVLGDPDDLDVCIRNAADHSKGKNLPPDWVPYDICWLVDNGEIIGIASIRHELNVVLWQTGGNIGYEIRPSKRRMGYGKKILELSLVRAAKIGLRKVLVASLEKNLASRKIIEANGGKLENKIKAAGEDDTTLRYWISI